MSELDRPAAISNGNSEIPPAYSGAATLGFFLLGGLVTAVYSGSLAVLATGAQWREVLAVGLIVPSFTWIVQLTASGLALPTTAKQCYWGDLGRVCLLGSLALLPAAAMNLTADAPPLWISAANVIASVMLMAGDLFRRAARHGVSWAWPLSFCLTIACNMALFCRISWHWWQF